VKEEDAITPPEPFGSMIRQHPINCPPTNLAFVARGLTPKTTKTSSTISIKKCRSQLLLPQSMIIGKVTRLLHSLKLTANSQAASPVSNADSLYSL